MRGRHQDPPGCAVAYDRAVQVSDCRGSDGLVVSLRLHDDLPAANGIWILDNRIDAVVAALLRNLDGDAITEARRRLLGAACPAGYGASVAAADAEPVETLFRCATLPRSTR